MKRQLAHVFHLWIARTKSGDPYYRISSQRSAPEYLEAQVMVLNRWWPLNNEAGNRGASFSWGTQLG